MNTASNWPMGSTLAELNLEIQTAPFATYKIGGDKKLADGTKSVLTPSTFGSPSMPPSMQSKTTIMTPNSDAMKWSQTR